MTIWTIRHGETDLNAKGVLQGRLDDPLNQNGRDLAAVTGRALRGVRFDRCITSPLSRARETVEILLRESGNDGTPILTDERIHEMDFGDLEGRKLTEMGDEGLLFYFDPFRFAGFPDGETIAQLCERTQAFFKELTACEEDANILVGTHGCAVRAMLNHLQEDPSDFWRGHAPYNCSVNIIEVRNGTARIVEEDRIFYDPSLAVDRYK